MQLFPELRATIRGAQWEAIDAAFHKIQNDMQAEFGSLLLDLRDIAIAEGEISESQRFPKSTDEIATKLNDLDSLIIQGGIIIGLLKQ